MPSYGAMKHSRHLVPKAKPGRAFGSTRAILKDIKELEAEANKECFPGGQINAFITETPLKSEQLPLKFYPVAAKDNFATAELPTTCASQILKDYKSPFEATAIQRLKAQNYPSWFHQPRRGRRKHASLMVGKTNMDEFGMGSHSSFSYFGPVLNLEQRSAGGSSGGSAMAAKLRHARVALGTDTGGSVRLPAAYTGILGFKPTYGLISRYGVVPYANSLDTVGILTRLSVKVMADELKALITPDVHDPTSVAKSSYPLLLKSESQAQDALRDGKEIKFRIGVPIEYNVLELDEDIRATWKLTLERLRSEGHTIIPISLPSTKHALSTYYILAAAEAASNLSKYDGVRYGTRAEGGDNAGGPLYSDTRAQGFGDEVKRRILLGSYTLSSEAVDNYFIQAQKVRRLIQRDFDRVFAEPNPFRDPEQFDLSEMPEDVQLDSKLGPAQVDFIVCPTAPSLSPKLETLKDQNPVNAYMNDIFTVPASLAGLPAISVPVKVPRTYSRERSIDDAGVTHEEWTGIQIIGQLMQDFNVLRLAESIQLHELNNQDTSK